VYILVCKCSLPAFTFTYSCMSVLDLAFLDIKHIPDSSCIDNTEPFSPPAATSTKN
jgi:hypothetical protein